MTRPRRTVPIAALLLLACLPMGGCAIFGAVAMLVAPPKSKAMYRLSDRPTLVLVDDPQRLVQDPLLLDRLGGRIEYDLTQRRRNGGPILTQLVPRSRLNAAMARMGPRYAGLSITELGRGLGAEQVIHVQIKRFTLVPEPGQVDPSATVEVKVVDAVDAQRLFPAPTGGPAPDPTAPGLALRVEGFHDAARQLDRTVARELGLALADRAGRQVARLFYDFDPTHPQERDLRPPAEALGQ